MARRCALFLLLSPALAAPVLDLPVRSPLARPQTASPARAPIGRSPGRALTSASSLRAGAAAAESKLRGRVSVAGGVLAHLVLGTLYCWGNFMSYAPPGLLFFDGQEHPGMTPDAAQVMPLSLVSQNLGLPLAALVGKKFGHKAATFAGCFLVVAGTYLSSFQTRLLPFMLFYSVVAGMGSGVAYTAPMVAGGTWFPESKGLINGITLFGFGTAAFIFNKVGTALAQGGTAWGPMLRKIATMYAIVSLPGALLVKPMPAAGAAADAQVEVAAGAQFKEAVTSKRFALLWCVGFLAFVPGLTLTGLYKRFGMSDAAKVVANDGFLSLMGGLAAMSSGLGRMFWGNTMDKIGFMKAYRMTTALQIAINLLMPFATSSKLAFGAVVCASLFCLGGSITMFVTVNAQTFGSKNAGEIYSLLFSALSGASVFGVKLAMSLLDLVGWSGIFKILALMSTLNLGVLTLFGQEKAKPAPWEAAPAAAAAAPQKVEDAPAAASPEDGGELQEEVEELFEMA
mmetsp:Transcript_49292/g.111844  ORF Transcript_49292/g.111844 Transcript_49292/m.111844 type:complete len:512 (-) Transcript_49292:370-1905(-)